MKYDFTTLPDRHGRDAIAVDGLGKGFAPDAPRPGFDAIPMWVADMNFVCLPTIQQAVIERVQHPAFGYFDPTPEYYDSIIRWQSVRNGVTGLTAEAIGYENGVLGGVISALNCVCSRGDKVLVHSPTYIGFTRCLENNGYDIVQHTADAFAQERFLSAARLADPVRIGELCPGHAGEVAHTLAQQRLGSRGMLDDVDRDDRDLHRRLDGQRVLLFPARGEVAGLDEGGRIFITAAADVDA